MSFSYSDDVSNQADFIVDISATDETNTAVDFTGAEISIAIKDDNYCQRLTASIGSGITLLDPPTTVELQFTADQMKGLCAGSYNIGGLYRKNGVAVQLLIGTISVYDGVARL